MLPRLPTPLVSILSYLGFYEVAERMCYDPTLAALRFHRVSKIDWFLFGCSDDAIS